VATINVNPAQVALVAVDEPMRPGAAAGPIQKGTYVSLDADGRYAPGGGPGGGIAVERAVAARYEVNPLKKGILELGDALQALDYDAPVFAAPDGTLDDADGAGANVRVGSVIAGWNDRVPRKLLRVDL